MNKWIVMFGIFIVICAVTTYILWPRKIVIEVTKIEIVDNVVSGTSNKILYGTTPEDLKNLENPKYKRVCINISGTNNSFFKVYSCGELVYGSKSDIVLGKYASVSDYPFQYMRKTNGIERSYYMLINAAGKTDEEILQELKKTSVALIEGSWYKEGAKDISEWQERDSHTVVSNEVFISMTR